MFVQETTVPWAAMQVFYTDGSDEAMAHARQDVLNPFQGRDSLFHQLRHLFERLHDGTKQCTFTCSKIELQEEVASEKMTKMGLLCAVAQPLSCILPFKLAPRSIQHILW